jgi:hypothetical protein
VRISQGLNIAQDEALRKDGNLVGWIRLDQNDNKDVESLRCIVIGQGTTGWEDYAGVSWGENLVGEFYYVMLAASAHPEQGDENGYQRRGVAVTQSGCLSFSEPGSKAAVI